MEGRVGSAVGTASGRTAHSWRMARSVRIAAVLGPPPRGPAVSAFAAPLSRPRERPPPSLKVSPVFRASVVRLGLSPRLGRGYHARSARASTRAVAVASALALGHACFGPAAASVLSWSPVVPAVAVLAA